MEEFYYTIRDRLEKDPDYDPEKYPHAHEYFKVRKWVGQQKEEEEKKKAEAAEKEKQAQAEGGASSSTEAKTGQEATPTTSQAAMGEDN